jgi:hypothetical protein
MARRLPDRFLVAFSLAGEQRELIRSIAEELERRLGESTVFYDEWFEFYIAGADADLKLQRIYRQQCELAVICISSAYDSRPWTRVEHSAVRARYMEASGSGLDRDRVLALRVGDGEVEGIHLNHLVPDLRKKSLDDAVQLIADRLQLVCPGVLKGEPSNAAWPRQLPEFRWPIADHTLAQAAFCAMLDPSGSVRFLAIEGVSETGKSSLATQMERNIAELLPGLRCGRFDFKGFVDRRIEVEAFPRSVGLSARIYAVGDQLSSVLNAHEFAQANHIDFRYL